MECIRKLGLETLGFWGWGKRTTPLLFCIKSLGYSSCLGRFVGCLYSLLHLHFPVAATVIRMPVSPNLSVISSSRCTRDEKSKQSNDVFAPTPGPAWPETRSKSVASKNYTWPWLSKSKSICLKYAERPRPNPCPQSKSKHCILTARA